MRQKSIFKIMMLVIISLVLITNFGFAAYQDECGELLLKMHLLSGYPDGTLKLENNITRAEFSILVMKMLGYKEENIILQSEKNFSDLKENHWARKSIIKATELGYLTGYEDNTFRPSNNLTYAECCAILVNVLGYNSQLSGSWPENVINKAESLEINNRLIKKDAKTLVTRGEVAIMLVNSLEIDIK
jgi:hypothetical protein